MRQRLIDLLVFFYCPITPIYRDWYVTKRRLEHIH